MPFQPSVMFVGKARSLLYSGAHERCFTQTPALLANIRLGWKVIHTDKYVRVFVTENFLPIPKFVAKARVYY
jgi:hypothetical protein